MKTIGLIGGMSWESTVEYYRLINEEVHRRLGGFHSAKCVLVSVDFAEVETLQHEGRWAEAGEAMVAAARQVQHAGAECLILCTNTMHIAAAVIQKEVDLPFLHIADATAQLIRTQGLVKIGLLGTRFTMEEDFYQGRLREVYGLSVLTPDAEDRGMVHQIIYEELVQGIIRPGSRQIYCEIIQKLVDQGAQGIILGCTEIGLLIGPADSPVPVFDTTRIHALSAVDYSLGS